MNYHRFANAGIKLPLLKSLRNGIFHNGQFQVLIKVKKVKKTKKTKILSKKKDHMICSD